MFAVYMLEVTIPFLGGLTPVLAVAAALGLLLLVKFVIGIIF